MGTNLASICAAGKDLNINGKVLTKVRAGGAYMLFLLALCPQGMDIVKARRETVRNLTNMVRVPQRQGTWLWK
jgi:hypothetical protein